MVVIKHWTRARFECGMIGPRLKVRARMSSRLGSKTASGRGQDLPEEFKRVLKPLIQALGLLWRLVKMSGSFKGLRVRKSEPDNQIWHRPEYL
jgi:hypothetical protein